MHRIFFPHRFSKQSIVPHDPFRVEQYAPYGSFIILREKACSLSATSLFFSDGPESGDGRAEFLSSGYMDDGGGGTSNEIIGAVKRSGIPILMVQSTMDALIGSPLALLLKQEVCVIGKAVPFVSYYAFAAYMHFERYTTSTRARGMVPRCSHLSVEYSFAGSLLVVVKL